MLIPENMIILKQIAQLYLNVLNGTEQNVCRYWDDNNIKYIDLLESKNSPTSGLTSYGTLGLSNVNVKLISNGIDLRIELIGLCHSNKKIFANIITTATFEIMDGQSVSYGSVMPNIISTYYIPDTTTPHLLFTNPSMWKKSLETLQYQDKQIAFLMVVPISDNEMRFLHKNGIDALEKALDKKHVDICDFYRNSIF